MNSHETRSGRPETAITPDQVTEGLAFVSYIPFKPDTVARGVFTSKPHWGDDESAHLVGVTITEADPNQQLSSLGPKTVELCVLGIGTNRFGETTSRVCVPDDAN